MATQAQIERIGTGSAVVRVANALRAAVLSHPDGTFLGSEEALLNQLGVSGPTLRQAARLLESEQLLDIRRGIGGGYYGRRPTMDVVTRMSATYLQTQAVGVSETVAVVGALVEPVARLAARSDDEALREELRTFEQRMARASPQETEVALNDLVARMGGNVALRLVQTIFDSYGFLREKRPSGPNADWLARHGDLRRRYIEALLDRDEDKAAAVALSRFQMVREAVLGAGASGPRAPDDA